MSRVFPFLFQNSRRRRRRNNKYKHTHYYCNTRNAHISKIFLLSVLTYALFDCHVRVTAIWFTLYYQYKHLFTILHIIYLHIVYYDYVHYIQCCIRIAYFLKFSIDVLLFQCIVLILFIFMFYIVTYYSMLYTLKKKYINFNNVF